VLFPATIVLLVKVLVLSVEIISEPPNVAVVASKFATNVATAYPVPLVLKSLKVQEQ
jgi:hypothetical protein